MIRYSPKLKAVARTLRSHTTESEQLLWSRLRRKQILNVQFYRQKVLGSYVVDFYAPSAQLVIEVDSSQHLKETHISYDEQRTSYLLGLGLKVLRFTNLEVFQEIDAVVETIWQAVQQAKSPLPPLYQRGEFMR